MQKQITAVFILVTLRYLLTIVNCQERLNYVDQSTWKGICIEGQYQSPIDIPSKAVLIPSNDIFTINKNNYALIENQALAFYHGYKYMLNTRNTNSSLFVNYSNIEYQYDLLEIHFHFKSEHTIQSNYIDIEMHMVHRKNEEYISNLEVDPDEMHQYLVVGVMFKASNSEDNAFISSLNFDTRTPVSNVDLNLFVNSTKSFYYYQGSFTTPPCNEIVHWIVMEQIELISFTQNELIKSWIREKYPMGNNRLVYPLNGRKLYYVNPSKTTSNKGQTNKNQEGNGFNFTDCVSISLSFILITLAIIGKFLKQ